MTKKATLSKNYNKKLSELLKKTPTKDRMKVLAMALEINIDNELARQQRPRLY